MILSHKVGLPAKSGVCGGLLVVIPNVLGIALWSPPLDQSGNSVRGIEFCKVSLSIPRNELLDSPCDNQN